MKILKNKLSGMPRIGFSQSKCEENLGEEKEKLERPKPLPFWSNFAQKVQLVIWVQLREPAAFWNISLLRMHNYASSYLKTSFFFFSIVLKVNSITLVSPCTSIEVTVIPYLNMGICPLWILHFLIIFILFFFYFFFYFSLF